MINVCFSVYTFTALKQKVTETNAEGLLEWHKCFEQMENSQRKSLTVHFKQALNNSFCA